MAACSSNGEGTNRSAPSTASPPKTPVAHGSTVAGAFVLGLNVSGLEDPVPAAPTNTMLDAYASHGIRRLRLPGGWQHFQPSMGGPLDESYLDMYRNVVRAAAARRMTVTVDACHSFGERNLVAGNDPAQIAELFADFWKKLVTALGQERGIVAWDLMNEPDQLGSRQEATERDALWRRAAQRAVTAIRSAGDTRVIKVEGCGHSSAEAWPVNNPTLHELTDPADRLVYSAHCYLDRDNSGQHAYWLQEVAAGDHVDGGRLTTSVGVQRITPFVAWLKQHGLQGEIGECGVGRSDSPRRPGDAGWLEALDTTLQYCQRNELGFFYWGTGPHLGADYAYSVEPYPDGAPAPQWRVLERFARRSD